MKGRVPFCAMLAIMLWAGGWLQAPAATADVLFGCVNVKQGTLRIVEAGAPCQRGETPVQWNQSGPPGPPGPPGPKGDPGAPGAGLVKLEDIQGLPCNTGAEAGRVTLAINPISHAVSLACPPANQFQLTVAVEGTGTIKSTPPGIGCGGGQDDCSHSYPGGNLVTLTESHDSGQMGFLGWGPPCGDAAPTCQVTMDQARLVTARFQPVLTVKLSTSATSREFNCVFNICVHVDVFTDSRARVRVIDPGTSAEIGSCNADTTATFVVTQNAPPSFATTTCNIAVPFGRPVELRADDSSALGGTQTFGQWGGGDCDGVTAPICTLGGTSAHEETAAFFF